MRIYSITPSYNNYKRINNNTQTSPIAFRGMSQNTVRTLESINSTLKDLTSKLNLKTEAGLEKLQEMYPDFSIEKGLIFHNCGEKKLSIAIKSAESKDFQGLTKIIVRQGNSTYSKRIVLDSFLVKDSRQLVSNFDRTHLSQFPKNCEFYTDEEISSGGMETKLNVILEELDFAMLKFRKFLAKNMDTDLKLQDGIFPQYVSNNIAEIFKIYDDVSSRLSGLSKRFSYNIKSTYQDYALKIGSTDHTLTNIGPEKLSMTLTRPNLSEHSDMAKLVVYNADGSIRNAFLIKDNNKLVANFNDKYINYIPEKLIYTDAQKLDSPENLPLLNTYLKMYRTKLEDFKMFVAKAIYDKSYKAPDGIFSGKEAKHITNIIEQYNEITEFFSTLTPAKVNTIKSNFPELYISAGKRGFTFQNFENNKSITVLQMASKNEPNLLRITIGGENSAQMYLIKYGQKVVKNYNPEYPQMVPPVLKFYDEDEIKELELAKPLEFVDSMLTKFKTFVQEENERLSAPKIRQVKEPHVTERVSKEKPAKLAQPKVVQPKPAKPIKQPKISSLDKKQLIKECTNELANAMKGIEDNLDNFNQTLELIKEKVTAFFEGKLNN